MQHTLVKVEKEFKIDAGLEDCLNDAYEYEWPALTIRVSKKKIDWVPELDEIRCSALEEFDSIITNNLIDDVIFSGVWAQHGYADSTEFSEDAYNGVIKSPELRDAITPSFEYSFHPIQEMRDYLMFHHMFFREGDKLINCPIVEVW